MEDIIWWGFYKMCPAFAKALLFMSMPPLPKVRLCQQYFGQAVSKVAAGSAVLVACGGGGGGGGGLAGGDAAEAHARSGHVEGDCVIIPRPGT